MDTRLLAAAALAALAVAGSASARSYRHHHYNYAPPAEPIPYTELDAYVNGARTGVARDVSALGPSGGVGEGRAGIGGRNASMNDQLNAVRGDNAPPGTNGTGVSTGEAQPTNSTTTTPPQ
jgi:hypothetical protein